MVKEVLVGTTAALVVLLAMWGVDVTPFLLLGGIVLVFRYAFDGKAASAKASRRWAPLRREKNVPAVSFDDIGGQEVAKRELLEALQFIKEDERTRKLGIRPLKGILLAGPPGTGKTLLAKAAANYADAVFLASAARSLSRCTRESERSGSGAS